jgi:hypothetical protein
VGDLLNNREKNDDFSRMRGLVFARQNMALRIWSGHFVCFALFFQNKYVFVTKITPFT